MYLGSGLDFVLSALNYDWVLLSLDLLIIGATSLVLIDQYYYKSEN